MATRNKMVKGLNNLKLIDSLQQKIVCNDLPKMENVDSTPTADEEVQIKKIRARRPV